MHARTHALLVIPAEQLVEDGETSLRQVAQALEAEITEEGELRDKIFERYEHFFAPAS
jgi:hypothetical protein